MHCGTEENHHGAGRILCLGFKFLSEYEVDFSRATIDGRLGTDFDPEEALRNVNCPMLLLHASWSRHETWGLLGAMDDKELYAQGRL